MGDVRFIRVHGRIVPVRGKGGEKKPKSTAAQAAPAAASKKPDKRMLAVKIRATTFGERFRAGAADWGPSSAVLGGGLAAYSGIATGTISRALTKARGPAAFVAAGVGVALGIAGAAALNGAAWGAFGGLANGVFGSRYKATVGFAKKKKK